MVSKKTKLIISISVLVLLLIASGFIIWTVYKGNTIRGNGKMVNCELPIAGDIKKLGVEGLPSKLNISTINSDKIIYKIDENLKDLLNIEINGGILSIYFSKNKSINLDHDIEFSIGSDKLEEISILGGAKVIGTGTFNAGIFKINAGGSLEASLNLKCGKIIVNVSGDADINFAGDAEELEINSEGDIAFNAKDLIASDVLINFMGNSLMEVYAGKNLTVNGEGGGMIKYWGNPKLNSSLNGSIQLDNKG